MASKRNFGPATGASCPVCAVGPAGGKPVQTPQRPVAAPKGVQVAAKTGQVPLRPGPFGRPF